MIKNLLTRDAIERKTRKWRLMSAREMDDIWEKSNEHHPIKENIFVQKGFIQDSVGYSSWEEFSEKVINRLNLKFTYLQDLLKEFEGSLILAGGSVYKSCIDARDCEDADIFFIDSNVEENPDIPKYTDLLGRAVSFLIQKYTATGKYIVYLSRNEHVTTVFCESIWNSDIFDDEMLQDKKFQFVHRMYPNIGSVLGGFDIGICMLAYTGSKIVATELGAWSLFNRSIIVDTTRRSTSYEHRLLKHSRYTHLIFPGLDPRVAKSKVEPLNASKMCEKVKDLLREKNVSICIGNEQKINFVQNTRVEEEKEELERKFHDIARMKGFSIYKIRMEYIGEIKAIGKCSESVSKQIKEEIFALTRNHGYRIEFLDFVSEHPGGAFSSVGYKIELPYIRLYPQSSWNGAKATPMSGGIPKYLRKVSDYGDNLCWHSMAALSNVTSLSHGNDHLKNVMCVTRFKNPNSALIPCRRPEDGYEEYLQTIKSTHEVTTLEEILQIVQDSFQHPYLGELKMSFDMRYDHILSRTTPNTYKRKRHVQRLFANDSEESPDTTLQRILQNAEKVKKNLTGVNWIVTNPGRQWTSSINPIMEDPREWYGPLYNSFRIGCEKVETTLRLMRLRKNSPFYSMDGNIFRYIVRLVVWENSLL